LTSKVPEPDLRTAKKSCTQLKMSQDIPIQIREALPIEDEAIAHHFYQLWLENQVLPTQLIENWRETILDFIARSRQDLQYQAFVAIAGETIVGSAGGQIFSGPYPNLFQPNYRRDGYLWGVYVEPAFRQQGIGKALTARSLQRLKAIGCTHAVLNASPFGKNIYTQLGFTDSNLMRLNLSEYQP
jgi:ribosomal protein S18 acetylase RimI-like enzyme